MASNPEHKIEDLAPDLDAVDQVRGGGGGQSSGPGGGASAGGAGAPGGSGGGSSSGNHEAQDHVSVDKAV